jgi:hypothetical protein
MESPLLQVQETPRSGRPVAQRLVSVAGNAVEWRPESRIHRTGQHFRKRSDGIQAAIDRPPSAASPMSFTARLPPARTPCPLRSPRLECDSRGMPPAASLVSDGSPSTGGPTRRSSEMICTDLSPGPVPGSASQRCSRPSRTGAQRIVGATPRRLACPFGPARGDRMRRCARRCDW